MASVADNNRKGEFLANGVADQGAASAPHPHAVQFDRLPPLNLDAGYWGMVVTQFLGAFNDNVFKQLMLLLAIPTTAKLVGGASSEEDQQGLATIVFSIPFVLFSGFAGYLSDKNSKRFVVLCCKGAEILITLLGMWAFMRYDARGNLGLLTVLFLMGVHSAFFGPGKLGILPEILRKSDLPRANGIMLMTTFLAIILGTASAGALGDFFIGQKADGTRDMSRMWMGSSVCVFIALVGFVSAWWIRPSPPAQPGLPFRWGMLAVDRQVLATLAKDPMLIWALTASSMFWMVSGITMQGVNSLGLVQLGVAKMPTSILTAIIGLGIAVGGAATGRFSGGKVRFSLVRYGAWAIVLLLGLLSLAHPTGKHFLGYWGSMPALAALGAAAGMYAIPLQVFLQSRPPEELRGRMIGVMNQANFIAILVSGALYKVFDRIVESQGFARSAIFAFTALLLLPVALLFRMRDPE